MNDIAVFFKKYDFLKISKVAEVAGINASLLRQYACDIKTPSGSQVVKVENAIHEIGRQLMKCKIL